MIVRIDHGQQQVSSPAFHVITALVSTYECDQCHRHLGTAVIDLALEQARQKGFDELEWAAWQRWLESEHRC